MDIDSFFVHVKTDDIYKDIAEDIETRFDTSNYEIDRPLPNKLGGYEMNQEDKSRKNLLDQEQKHIVIQKKNNDENKKSKGYKKVCHKKKT